jgi:hypothetical protein
MTVIAYRDGVMAADAGGWRGDAVMPWFRKVARGPDGALYGGSGSAARVCEFLAWVDGGCLGEMPLPRAEGKGRSDMSILIARPDGGVEILSHESREILTGAPYAAIGACAEVCLGAMYAGADAETAIRAALEHGNGASGSAMVVRR